MSPPHDYGIAASDNHPHLDPSPLKGEETERLILRLQGRGEKARNDRKKDIFPLSRE